jgi:hypothetical protein
MRFIQRLFYTNFWYELSLNLTIWGTLKKTSGFNPEEIKKTKKRYKQLKIINRNFIKDIQSEYHVSWCSIILAVYETCKSKQMSQEESIAVTEKAIFTNMRPDAIAHYIKISLDKAKDAFAAIVKSSKNQETKFFGSTFVFYRPVDTPDSYHLRVSDCMYNNYFRKNGAPELMKIACKWDMVSWTKGIIPEAHKVVFKRPITLGLDNKDCEFDFDRIK